MKLSIPLVSLTNADNKKFCCHCPLINNLEIKTRYIKAYETEIFLIRIYKS